VGYFKRTRAGIKITLDPVETAVLEQVMGEMSEVIGQPPDRSGGQQWARDLGLGSVGADDPPRTPGDPDDPIRARLFPAAYQGEDDVDGAAQDFRRFTEDDLRAGKAANAAALLDSLPEGGGSLVLDENACQAWLGGLNDARLALGTALEVDENTEYELAALEPEEPRAHRLLVYHWLGELQTSLLDALMR
jgi:Domain of unknown function (DUF2017)